MRAKQAEWPASRSASVIDAMRKDVLLGHLRDATVRYSRRPWAYFKALHQSGEHSFEDIGDPADAETAAFAQVEFEVLDVATDHAQGSDYLTVLVLATDFRTTLKTNLFVYESGLTLLDVSAYVLHGSGQFERISSLWADGATPGSSLDFCLFTSDTKVPGAN